MKKSIFVIISLFLILSPVAAHAGNLGKVKSARKSRTFHGGYPIVDIQAEQETLEYNQDDQINIRTTNNENHNRLVCGFEYDPEIEACRFERCMCQLDAQFPENFSNCDSSFSDCNYLSMIRNMRN